MCKLSKIGAVLGFIEGLLRQFDDVGVVRPPLTIQLRVKLDDFCLTLRCTYVDIDFEGADTWIKIRIQNSCTLRRLICTLHCIDGSRSQPKTRKFVNKASLSATQLFLQLLGELGILLLCVSGVHLMIITVKAVLYDVVKII